MAKFVAEFVSQFWLVNQRTGTSANLKSPLAIISADVRGGDTCSIRILGPDQEQAARALEQYLGQELAKENENSLPIEAALPQTLPRALQSPAITRYPGVPVSPGIGKGKAVVVGRLSLSQPLNGDSPASREQEERRVERAIATLRARLQALLSRSMSAAEKAVLEAHQSILDDVSFTERITASLAAGQSAGEALIATGKYFISLLKSSE